jgi:hypothetical protein
MGTYSKSTFGEISGKVGESVASNWRSLKVLRSVPKKSSKPPSEKRLAVYARFTLAAARLSPIKSVLNIGFSDKTLNKITGYNAAVKTFLTESILGVVNDIALSWPADVDGLRSNLDDRMYFIIYNEMKDSYKLNIASTRNDAAIALPFPGKAGDVLHVWSFCVARDGKLVSRSQYVGSVTVPA